MKIRVYTSLVIYWAVSGIAFMSGMGPALQAAESPDMAVMRCNEKITTAILNGEYQSAEQIADAFIESEPDYPAGPLFRASVRQYRAVDYDDFSDVDEFSELIDETMRRAQAQLNVNEHDRWAQYFSAAAQGLDGSYASLTGSLLTGILKGRAGAAAMGRISAEDSAFYDAYLFLGSYHYWKSDAASWLPFVKNEKEQGIREVRQAIKHGFLTGPLANTVLLEILLDHDPEQACALADSLVSTYPRCRLFRWQLGEAYKKLEQFSSAEQVFIHIADSFIDDPYDDGSGPLRCWWKLAVLAADIGRTEDCLTYSRRVIEAGEPPSVAARQQERIRGARNYIEEFAHAE